VDEIITERSGSILRVELNRPAKKNAMTSSMYVALADVLNGAAADESVRVVLWHGAGDSFCAGNDVEDFLTNPPVLDQSPQLRPMSDAEDFLWNPTVPGESPQLRLMNALVDFDKPLVAAVQGAAIGGGTTMLTHCDFVYAGESARFQMPFVDLAVVPEFGSSCSIPARIGHIRASELILLGRPFDARRALAVGLVTDVVPDDRLLATATETARSLAAKWPGALRASKRLMKRPFRDQIKAAMKAENEEFSARIRSQEARQALVSFVERHQPSHDRSAA
jgi:enoyl-CoA hydratase/carnithine racemase